MHAFQRSKKGYFPSQKPRKKPKSVGLEHAPYACKECAYLLPQGPVLNKWVYLRNFKVHCTIYNWANVFAWLFNKHISIQWLNNKLFTLPQECTFSKWKG